MTTSLNNFLSDKSRENVLLKVIAFVWFITKLFSYKTWIADRKYPVIAPLDFLQNIPSGIHLCLFGIAMLMLCAIIISSEKFFIILFLIFEFLSCSLDTVRWQPWEFMYLCIFVLYLFNLKRKESFYLLVHLFLASIYIFSGLHKFNRGFLTNVWTQMILQNFMNLSIATILSYKLFFIGLMIPFTEFAAGFLLLFSRYRKWISYFLISVHIIVLMIIGPFGLNYNPIVWSWNLVMIFLLVSIYGRPIGKIDTVFLKQNVMWLLLWFVMPVFSFFGLWYQYFSSGLYTGKEKQLYIYISKQNQEYKAFSEADNLNSNRTYYHKSSELGFR